MLVEMSFPEKLTDEEQALVNKYEALKKKKKSQSSIKPNIGNSLSLDVNKIVTISTNVGKEKTRDTLIKESAVKPKDAKERAKRLLAAGQLKIDKDTGNRSFKRARPSNSERKPRPPSLSENVPNTKPQVKKVDNSRRDRDEFNKFPTLTANKTDGGSGDNFNNNQRRSFGQRALHVSGYGLTRNIIETAFVDFGPIKSTYFDQDKGVGYVTFHQHESAQKAIDDLHGAQVQGVNIKVGFVRKRGHHADDNRYTTRPSGVKPDHSNRTERLFSDNRAHHSDKDRMSDDSPQKRNDAKKRKLVTYDDKEEFDF